ncbi:MAG: spondin domain-containing protein [Phycisphaerales bacterium]
MITKISAIAALMTAAGAASADTININIENTLGDGGFFFTPVWVAAHNGGFDSYDGGSLASDFPGITSLAENGATGQISAAFAGSAAGIAGGVDGTVAATSQDAPVFSPGESASFSLDVGDATVNRYFSYASMLVPSNDLFFANGNPLAIELFDAGGNFLGPRVIEIYGSDLNDNGTEVNSATNDAAFSTNDGQALPESEVIRNFFTQTGDQAYLDSFIGSTTPNGATITNSFGSGDLIARITVTPTPGTAGLLAMGGLIAARRRRA